MAKFAATFVVLMVMVMADDPVATLASAVIGGVVGTAALAHYRRCSAYRTGWMDGRMQMVSSLAETARRAEASRQDLDLVAWLSGEADRDWVTVFGPGQTPPRLHD